MKIVTIGDSFTYGEGCVDPATQSWPSLIAKNNPDYQVINLGIPGTDNLTIAGSLWNNLSSDINLIIFAASFTNRIQIGNPECINDIKNPSQVMSLGLHSRHKLWSDSNFSPTFDRVSDEFYKYLYNDYMGSNYALACLLSVYACSQSIGAKFCWSMPSINYFNVPDEIQNFIASSNFLSCCDYDYQPEERAVCRHPNAAGYQRYYNEIIMPLINKYTKD